MTEDPGEAAARDLENARPSDFDPELEAAARALLPEGVEFGDLLDLVYERVNGMTRVIASMAGAKITVEVDYGREGQAQALVMGLPVLMATAYDNLEGDTSGRDTDDQ